MRSTRPWPDGRCSKAICWRAEMTREIVGVNMKCVAILSAAAFLLSAQQAPKPPTKSSDQGHASKSPPDNWQKMKDCAIQAEKAIAEHNRRSISLGGHGPDR